MSWLLAACSSGPRQLLQLLKEVIDQEYSGGLLVGSALALAVNVVYTLAAKALHHRVMVARFLYGAVERPIRAPRHLIDRSYLINQVKHALTKGTAYYSIVGPKGSGKSWVVQQAASKVPGCLYLSLPANLTEEDFVTLLAETFNFRFERRVSWAEVLLEKLVGSSEAPENEMSHFLRVTEAVEEVAASAAQQLGYTPTLILDNCGYVPTDTLGKLHDWAYDCSCRGVLRLVFVMAQNPIFGCVLKRPATFRMELLYVEDIKREEAILYLQQSSGVPESEAADLVDNYVGCRLMELEKTCHRLNFPKALYGDPATNVRRWTLQRVLEVLRQLGLAYVLCGHNPDLDVNGYLTWQVLLHLADNQAAMPWEQFVGMVSAEVARTHAHFPALFRLNAAGHVVIDPSLATAVRTLAGTPGTAQRETFLAVLQRFKLASLE